MTSTTGDTGGAGTAEQQLRTGQDADAAQLAELGYEPQFNRDMSLAANFALGFTYLSPVVGVYALFAFALAEAGPPMLWSFFIVGSGQFLVALVFGEVVSQYPLAGGVYPWARRLWGRRVRVADRLGVRVGAADHRGLRRVRSRGVRRHAAGVSTAA